MREALPRILLAAVAAVEFCCGVILFYPFYDGSASYVYPRLVLFGAVFFIAFAGFLLAMATIGFRSLRSLLLSWRLFTGGDANPRQTHHTKPHRTTTTTF